LIVFLLETGFPPQISIKHCTIERQFPNHPHMYEVYLCDPTQVQRRSFTKILRKIRKAGGPNRIPRMDNPRYQINDDLPQRHPVKGCSS
jgi:hypothetical protein